MDGPFIRFRNDSYSLFAALLKVNHKRSALSCLILTQQRLTCKILYNVLKDVKAANPTEFGFLKHDYVVGFNVNPFKHTREEFYTKKLSMQVLLKFKNGYVFKIPPTNYFVFKILFIFYCLFCLCV